MYNQERRRRQYQKEQAKKIEHELQNGLDYFGKPIRLSDFIKSKIDSGKTQVLIINEKVIQFRKNSRHGYWVNNTYNLRLHREKVRLALGLTEEQMKGLDVHHLDRDKDNNDITNLQLMTKAEHTKLHAIEDGKELSENKPPKPKYIKKICEWCRKEYESSSNVAHKQRFCSNKCKAKYRRANGLNNTTRICKNCGKEFICDICSHTQFCSLHCAGKYNYYNNKNSRKCNELNIKYRRR